VKRNAHFWLLGLLTRLPAEATLDRFYRTLDALLPHKEKVEVFLKERLGEWVDHLG